MPELPEVEVTRLSFADRIATAHIQAVHMGKPLRWPLGCDPNSLHGQQVLSVRRRGKYLLIDLSSGLLLVHLVMQAQGAKTGHHFKMVVLARWRKPMTKADAARHTQMNQQQTRTQINQQVFTSPANA